MTIQYLPQNFDFFFVFKASACWEVLYAVLAIVLRNSPHEKIRQYGNSYGTAFVNALIISMVGLWTLKPMLEAPNEARAFVVTNENEPFYSETQLIRTAAYIFISWLLFDLSHIILNFPHLGGVDQLIHHSGFLTLTYLCVFYEICPYAGSWLFCCEFSTLPLNLRWFLIQSGRGDSMLMHITNMAFAILFFATRIVLYWIGVLEFIQSTLPLLFTRGVPLSVLSTFAFLLVAGALLNAFWFTSIIQMARGQTRKKKNKNKPSSSSSSIPCNEKVKAM
jgi:preprotein translocase subunit SecG